MKTFKLIGFIILIFSLPLSTVAQNKFTGASSGIEKIKKNKKKTTPPKRKAAATASAEGTTNGHEWVDLGLSVKWATCNIGAKYPEQVGDYISWSELGPKRDYPFETPATGKEMKDISGDVQYDAATKLWGSSWRIPTKEEFEELIKNCTLKATDIKGYKGMEFTSKINGRKIFLPFAGQISYDGYYGVGNLGRYWTSTPSPIYGTNDRAYNAEIEKGATVDNIGRMVGLTIRPVCK